MELLPQEVHPRQRVVRGELQHDATGGVGVEVLEERHEVGDIEDDVVHDHHVVDPGLRCDVRPLPLHLAMHQPEAIARRSRKATSMSGEVSTAVTWSPTRGAAGGGTSTRTDVEDAPR